MIRKSLSLALAILFLVLLVTGGCTRRYRLSDEARAIPSTWPQHRGEPASLGAAQEGNFNGKLSILWEESSNDKPAGPLSLAHGTLVYAGTKRKVKFYNAADGSYQGKIKVKGVSQTGMVVNDTLGLVALAPPKSRVMCLNLKNGSEVWRYPLRDATAGSIIVKDRLIMSSVDGRVSAWVITTGELLWDLVSESSLSAPPSYGYEKIFQPTDRGGLLAISPDDGSVLYEVDVAGPIVSAIAVSKFLYGADVYGNAFAIDPKDGHVIWKRSLNGQVWGAPAVADDRVIVCHTGGKVAALDASVGTPLWEFEAREVITSAPTIAGRYVVVGTMAGKVISLDAADGQVVETRDLNEPIAIAPVTDGDRVYVATQKGSIICFGENNAPFKTRR